MKGNQIYLIIIGLFIFSIGLTGQENQTGTIFIHTKPENVSVQISKLDYKIKNKPAGRIVINDVPPANYKFKFTAHGLELTEKLLVHANDTLTVVADFYRMELTGKTAGELRKQQADIKRQKYIQSLFSDYSQSSENENKVVDGFYQPSTRLMDSLINFLYPGEEVFFEITDLPLFNGVDPKVEFRKYIAYNLRYPDLAAENGIMGRVVVMFAVNSLGKVVEPFILEGADPILDREAIRVVTSSPLWTPGMHNGIPVKVVLYFPINFVLQ